MSVTIRAARPEDGDALRAIERLAGERFREVGLAFVADDDPDSIEVLASYALDGRSWVATDRADAPVGYVLVDVVDDCAHVEQVSVVPHRQGQGVGRALIAQVRQWAVTTDRVAVTLTTFADVPWNRPLYEHLDFRVMSEAEIGAELRNIRETEALHGLDPATRVCMRLDLHN